MNPRLISITYLNYKLLLPSISHYWEQRIFLRVTFGGQY